MKQFVIASCSFLALYFCERLIELTVKMLFYRIQKYAPKNSICNLKHLACNSHARETISADWFLDWTPDSYKVKANETIK